MKPITLSLLGGLGLAACGGAPKPVETLRLGPARDTILVPYTFITTASRVGESSWAVVAPNEREVAIVSFDDRTVRPLPHTPDGGYQQPAGLFRAGDTLYLADWSRRALLIWTLEGKQVRSIPASPLLRGVLPAARDGQGRFYVALNPPPRSDGSGNRDSTAIVRVSAEFTALDSVGMLAPPDVAEVFGQNGRRFDTRALSGRDMWGVLPDGSVWIARVNQNRVMWRSPEGTWSRGPTLPDRALLVLPEDRELFIQQFPPDLRPSAERVPFAITKPPFDGAFTDPAGNVWLVKSYALVDSTRAAQVVGRDGHLLRQIEYPGYGRLLGANDRYILVGEPYEKGYRLLRFEVRGDGQ
ncbi:MAG: hypothetical protein AB7I33_15130 [Gemmatimonadales bacterium]